MADIARWSDPGSYSHRWSRRAEIIAGFLGQCRKVADLGAGTQILRPLLKGDYFPVDAVSLGPDTVLIDFDMPWSVSDLPQCDGLAIAGLLEHVEDPLALVRKLRGVGEVWAVSYMDSEIHTDKPLVSLERLEAAFGDAGMSVTDSVWWRHQKVYRLIRA